MATEPKNSGKQWTASDATRLEDLATRNTPTGLIAHNLGRSEDAVRAKDISLKPTNQSPYNPRKK